MKRKNATQMIVPEWRNLSPTIIIKQSNLGISKLMGLFFTSSNYPKCKLICTSGNFELVKKPPTQNYGCRKQLKCIFYSYRRFEFRRIRNIRIRDIEIRLYLFCICDVICEKVPDSATRIMILDHLFSYRVWNGQ